MADQHIGFPGSVSSVQLATWIPNVGSARYSVEGGTSAQVVVAAGVDRGITVLPGTIYGDGIMDVFENPTSLAFASVSSGDRWDMVVCRRTWNPTPGASTAVYTIIQGGSSRVLPNRQTNRGSVADQPIALCRIRAGQSAVQEIVDLRCWADNGGVYANDDLVKDYLNEPGTHLTIGSTQWVRAITSDNTKTAYWYSRDIAGPWVTGTYYSGWRTVTNGTPFMARLLGNGMAQVIGECVYEGPNGQPGEGWSPGVLPKQFWSAQVCFIPGTIQGYNAAGVYYCYNGEVRFLGTMPKGYIAQFNGIYPLN